MRLSRRPVYQSLPSTSIPLIDLLYNRVAYDIIMATDYTGDFSYGKYQCPPIFKRGHISPDT